MFHILLLVGFVALGSVDAQVVNVTIFTGNLTALNENCITKHFVESQCPFCTRLLREQIWPFHATRPGNCEFTYDKQCDLNRISHEDILASSLAFKGLSNLDEAYQRCLSRLSPRTQQRLIECSRTQTGEVLNYYSMVNTHRAGVRIWPTMYVNGQFFDRSYPVETKICEHTTYC
ncbi:hypothetical protein M3Y97_00875600 [Aphelenchoides bicaudatus]|nr:hypothetical protein M3Y97_00875600 [Aphelenchoides bicaudatus]